MASDTIQLSGLTRLILDCLWSLHAELLEEGEEWTAEMLDQVEDQVRSRLTPAQRSPRQQMIFDMVFQRAFGEARDICLAMTYVASMEAKGELLDPHAALAI